MSDIIDMLENVDRRPRPPADHHGSLGWRSVHPDPARSRVRCGGGGDQLGADRGREGDPALPDQILVPRPEEPGEPASSGRPDRRSSGTTSSRTRSVRSESLRTLRALPHPRPPARSSGEAHSRTSTPARTTPTSTTTTTHGPPLLFISGKQDPLFPPKVGHSNVKHYKSNTGHRDRGVRRTTSPARRSRSGRPSPTSHSTGPRR